MKVLAGVVVFFLVLIGGLLLQEKVEKYLHKRKVQKAIEMEHVAIACPMQRIAFHSGVHWQRFQYVANGRRYYMERLCADAPPLIKLYYMDDPSDPFTESWEDGDNGVGTVGIMMIAAFFAIAIFFLL